MKIDQLEKYRERLTKTMSNDWLHIACTMQ